MSPLSTKLLAAAAAVPMAAAILLSPSAAHADWRRHGGYGYGYGHGGYYRGPSAGAIIGGAALGLGVGALLAAPYYAAPPRVVYAPPPAYYPPPGYAYVAPGYPPPVYYPAPAYYR